MSRARMIPMVVPAFAILALGAGCGGGKDQVTAAELIQKADGICRQEQTKFSQIQTHPPVNASDAADQTKELVQTAESADSQLGDLEPPDELRAPFESYLSARGRAIDQMKHGQDAAENQDSRAYGASQAAVVRTAPERRRLAQAAGLNVCGANRVSA
jgi:ElaB/YqjD/DUF883 family membrane-anchored ribosome-binding protein